MFAALLIALCCNTISAQTADSVDVLDYDIWLDLSQDAPFGGDATLTLKLLRACPAIALQLYGTVDSAEVDGVRIANPALAALPTQGIAAGRVFTIRIWYKGQGFVESGDWGGFHFDRTMSYNLGVGFGTDPHSLGRAVFPCRDNFHDKATYTLRVKTKAGWSAECGGELQERTVADDGTEHSLWRIAQQTPTYLVSVSQAAFTRIHDSIPSLHGTYPLTLGYLNRDSLQVRYAFAQLDSVVPQFERCFGPYRWGRIGYIATRKGSMEHVNNIALATSFMTSVDERAQTTIAHELGHAWFGNLVTCQTSADMWINEGGASFTSEVAMEAVQGRAASDDYYQRNLERVIRATHVTDGGYRPLSPMPHSHTYGSTTYDKGWMVWHSLRGHLGEGRFYSALRLLMERCAYGNIDSYRLRDSLSLYTGVDLTDFFDFYVFGTGFMDYHATIADCEGGSCDIRVVNLTLRQQPVGNTQRMRVSRVPVTFFSETGDTAKVWFELEDDMLDFVLTLPFQASYCVLDYDKELSDAATLGEAEMAGENMLYRLHTAHINLKSQGAAKVHVEHHWGTPHGPTPYGAQRLAQRYWLLRGQWKKEAAVQGKFHYVRGNHSSSYLDLGFYNNAASIDSLALLYRPSVDSAWRLMSLVREGNANEGYLVADSLLPGEYTLAMVDSVRIGINPAASREANLFPNPLGQGQPLTVDVPTEHPFGVSIFDAEGRQIWHKEGVVSGQKLRPALLKGTYFVLIENNFLSLHSKLIAL